MFVNLNFPNSRLLNGPRQNFYNLCFASTAHTNKSDSSLLRLERNRKPNIQFECILYVHICFGSSSIKSSQARQNHPSDSESDTATSMAARAATDIKVVWDSCLWDSDRWDGWEAQAQAPTFHCQAMEAHQAKQAELLALELEAARPRPPTTPPTIEQIRRWLPDYLQQPPAPKRMRVVPSPVLGYLSDQEYTVYYYARYTVWRNF